MERKLNPGVRPTHTVLRYGRPAVIAARSRIMDVVKTPQPVVLNPAESISSPKVPAAVPTKARVSTSHISDVIQASRPHRSSTKPLMSAGELRSVDMKPTLAAKPATMESLEALFAAPDSEPSMHNPISSVAAQTSFISNSRGSGNRRFGLRKQHLLYGLASVLFIAGIFVAVDGWFMDHAASTQAQVLAAESADSFDGEDRLNEDKPSASDDYEVAPDLPRTISIPTIDVNARVLQLGVKANNELATPRNIYDAGWYTGSSKPTDSAGVILVDGYVNGPTKPGIFYDLKKLTAGDEMILERGDGVRLTFVVTRLKTVKTVDVDMNEMMRSDNPAKLALNLITWGGSFDAKSNEFESRVLVFAVQK